MSFQLATTVFLTTISIAMTLTQAMWPLPPTGDGIRPLTETSLAEAIKIGSAEGGANQAAELGLPFIAFAKTHGMNKIAGDPKLNARFEAISKGPYSITITTPFIDAAMTVAEAKRKFQDAPPLSLEKLNARRVSVNVGPGRSFLDFGIVENFVIKRGTEVLRPLDASVTPTTIQNRMGATATASEGRFTFDFSAFEPSSSIVLVVIGKSGNWEWEMTPDELRWLR